MTTTRFLAPLAPLLFVVSACASTSSTPAAAPVSAAPTPVPAATPAPGGQPAAPAPAPPAQPAPAAVAAARPPQAILADAVKATGGEAAWNAHKTARYRVETVFQGMGLSGSGERFVTRAGKAFTTVEMAGLGNVREGTNGSVAWSQEPLHGLRILDGVEAEQTRIGAAWNQDMQAAELFTKLESANEPGPDGTTLECVTATPRVGAPIRSCYDARTHLQVTQSGIRVGPEGSIPFRATVSDWRDIGGVKMPFQSNTQLGPITLVDRIKSVTFDEPIDDKLFDPPALPNAPKPGKPSKDSKSRASKPPAAKPPKSE